jgi:beta-phosphoglucomutase-like phosphatase (HAD superfamily)
MTWRNMIPSNIKALILDMDGVLWKAETPIGDLPSIFKRISRTRTEIRLRHQQRDKDP